MTKVSPAPSVGDTTLEPGPGSPQAAIDAAGGRRSTPRPDIDAPWTDSRFWLLQLIVLALYLLRVALSVSLHLDTASPAVEFTTVAVFLIPVVYAALNYGLPGALVTSVWVSVLAIPRFVMYMDIQNAVGAWAEMMQVAVLNVIAILVGHRVSAERAARRVAEDAEQAHLRAEALYRTLFESNQAPILITDSEGRVVEANASAHHVFPRSFPAEGPGRPGDPVRPRLLDVIGPEAASQLLTHLVSARSTTSSTDLAAAPPGRVEPVSIEVDGERSLFRPTATTLAGAGGIHGMQVVFEDVTAETRRHDRMEAYATQVVLGQEEERRHLAQELHDGPVQTLIHLCRQIDAVEASAGASQGSQLALSDLRVIVEGTVAELRGIARGLRPSILDDLGLVASISQMLADAGRRNPFETSIGVIGIERRLPPPVELALFRIAQEALSNVERHAQASRVDVGLDFGSGGLRLLIRDDGVGIPALVAADGSSTGTLGLSGMAERARHIGGTVALHSGESEGTTVDVWVSDAEEQRE
jgi:signal transduction histidine kinase